MIYQLVSAKSIIARIDNNFNIPHSDWIPRCGTWILDALDRIGINNILVLKKVDLTVTNYTVELPVDSVQDIRSIKAVIYDEERMQRIGSTIGNVPESILHYGESKETYYIQNGYIVTSIEEGTITVYYKTIPVEYDEELMGYFPQIPDNSIIQDAIVWYIIYAMLKRGYKHPTYDLNSKNFITNPFLMWEQERKKAVNQISALDSDERYQFSEIYRTFLLNYSRPISD